MNLMDLINCYAGCDKLGLVKSKETLEKVINGITKQLLKSQKPAKTKAEPNAEAETKQEVAA